MVAPRPGDYRTSYGPAERASRTREAFPAANEDPLWQALKAMRMQLAREQGVPPYVIFHDSTLLEIYHQPRVILLNWGLSVG